MTNKHIDSERRHDFVLIFEVTDGNPNGDPDAGNLPRVDPETMQGLVTDVCLKRKVRNYVDAIKGTEDRYKIYVQNKEALNSVHQRAYSALSMTSAGTKQKREDVEKAREWMCKNFYDIRTFGAVMTTGVNCGQVRGPLQMTFARSLDPIIPLDISITRIAVTKPEDFDFSAEDKKGGKTTEMGRKAIVPYGLYVGMGFYNPHFAKSTGFDADDLNLFWQALQQMWDLDRSASRGFMACRGLYVFSHETALGNAPAHQLKSLIKVKRKDGVSSPRQFEDYDVSIENNVPEKVTLTKLVG
ncbi:MAG: type I-C CRISPR-associated protein Cas7/Csd2 [Candidatus Sericytochromatia bacterium]|nr:type I-C CRISPR-associated protein Cas7/Csd2 [Candidatus Sericytochromatia bacterium]